MATKEVNQNNWKEEVLDSDLPVLVDFWAEWCGPCRAIAPALEAISEEYGDKILIRKLNVDENPELSREYNIRSIPNMKVFLNGEVQQTIVGAKPKKVIETELEGWLS